MLATSIISTIKSMQQVTKSMYAKSSPLINHRHAYSCDSSYRDNASASLPLITQASCINALLENRSSIKQVLLSDHLISVSSVSFSQ